MKKILMISILILLVFNTNVTLGCSKYKNEWQRVVRDRKMKLEETPKDYISKYELAVAYSNLGEIKKATKLFKSFKQLKKRDEKLEELITDYEKKLKKSEPDIKNINFLAFAHYTADNYKQAQKLLKEIVVLDPENIWSYNYLAVAEHELKYYNKAEKTLKKSLNIKNDEYTHFLLGANYYKKGNIFKAVYHVGKGRKAADLFLND